MAAPSKAKQTKARTGAVPAAALAGGFPRLDLPVAPPLPPMEARPAERLPSGAEWLYEPKWDGFRSIAFRAGAAIALQSKSCQPLGRYFPELEAAFAALRARRFALDGEIVIAGDSGPADFDVHGHFASQTGTPSRSPALPVGRLDFDALLQRIHPAASRIEKLARETPASFYAFDLLVDRRGKDCTSEPLSVRRERLEDFAAALPAGGRIHLSPATRERALAKRWLSELAASSLDGVIAKRLEAPYVPGGRDAMLKVKRVKTADCVVGGFRWAQEGGRAGGKLGSLLLGLYDQQGLLDHVGFCASFTAEERRELTRVVVPLIEPPGFTGHAPGGPSRWSQGRSTEWEPLRPELVCEVRYDHFSGDRFRHGTKFLRWRPDKAPRLCTFDQVRPALRPLSALRLQG